MRNKEVFVPNSRACRLLRRKYEGAVGGGQGAFQPWAARQRSPGLAGSPEGCCGLNAREAASGLLVEPGRHFDRYMEQVWIESCVSLSSSLCGARILARRTVSASDARSSLRSVTPTTLALPSASSLIAFRARSALHSWRLQRLASRTESAHPPACCIQQNQIRRQRPCRVLHPMWPQWSSSHACDAKRTAVRTESTHVRNGGEQAPARWRPLSARDEALHQWCTKTIRQTHG